MMKNGKKTMMSDITKNHMTPEEFVKAITPQLVNYLEGVCGKKAHPEDLTISAWAFLDVASRVVGIKALWENQSEN